MAKKILIPTDNSPPSEAAAEYAVRMAKAIDASVVAMHVVDDVHYTGYHWKGIRDKIIKQLEKEGKESIKKIKEIGKNAGVEVEGVIVHGFAHEEIAKYARENKNIIMMVMAGSGKGCMSRIFLGSTTEKVVRSISKTVSVPVVITPYRGLMPEARFEL